MRSSRGWPLAALPADALLCASVATCADPAPTGIATPADTGRAADGGELMMAAQSSGGGDTIFDPFGPRLTLAISTGGEPSPRGGAARAGTVHHGSGASIPSATHERQ